jgi:hypothetical protein
MIVACFSISKAYIPKKPANRHLIDGAFFSSLQLRLGLHTDDLYSPPTKPRDFGRGFVSPKPLDNLYLAQRNRHPLDDSIRFDEPSHQYLVHGKPAKTSVTSLIDKYFEKFNPDYVIERMMKGDKWPREGELSRSQTSGLIYPLATCMSGIVRLHGQVWKPNDRRDDQRYVEYERKVGSELWNLDPS